MGKQRAFSYRTLRLVGLCGVVAGLLAGPAAFSTSTQARAAGHAVVPAVAVNPPRLFEGGGNGLSSTSTFTCQPATASVRCYAPHQIRQAYNIEPVLAGGTAGQGRTIVIIDAFQSPTIITDVQTFNSLFGLQPLKLNIIAPQGLTPFNPSDPNQVGWAGEITLDVEWAHAIAPDATVDLVLAKDNQDQDLLDVTKYAVNNNLGDVISQSFGEGETCATPMILTAEHQVYQAATNKGMTIFASAGDQGAAQATQPSSTLPPSSCNNPAVAFYLSASTPASDPLVTGVGGTSLNANPVNGRYIGETVWNDSYGAGGGGFSTIYQRPAYQNGVPGIGAYRGVPDVSYNGDVNGGVLAVWSSSGLGANLVFIFGGTSAGSPQWAGITALADQAAGRRLGALNTAIYTIAQGSSAAQAFHDILYGNNTYNGTTPPIIGYNTAHGWDAASGWGSPNVANLIPLLIQNIPAQ